MAISNEDKAFLEKLTEETAFRITSGMKENIDSLKSTLSVSPTPTGEKPKSDDQRKPKGDNDKQSNRSLGDLVKGIGKLVIAQKLGAKAQDELGKILNRQAALSSRLVQVGNLGLLSNKEFVVQAAKRNIDLQNHTSMILGGYDAGLKGWGESVNDLMTRVGNLGLSTTLASRHMVFLTQAIGLSTDEAAKVISSQIDLANSNHLMGDHLIKAMVELTDAFTSTTVVFGENMTKGVMEFAKEAHVAVGPGLKDAMNSAITKFTDTSVQNLRRTVPAGITDQALIADPKGTLIAAFQKIVADADMYQGSREGMEAMRLQYRVTDVEIAAMRKYLRNPIPPEVAGQAGGVGGEAEAVRKASFNKQIEAVFMGATATQMKFLQDLTAVIHSGGDLKGIDMPDTLKTALGKYMPRGMESLITGSQADTFAKTLGTTNTTLAFSLKIAETLLMVVPLFRGLKLAKVLLGGKALKGAAVGGRVGKSAGTWGTGAKVTTAGVAGAGIYGAGQNFFGEGNYPEVPEDMTAHQQKLFLEAQKTAEGIGTSNRDVLQTIAENTGSTAESNLQIQSSSGGIHSEIIILKDLLPITFNAESQLGTAPEPYF